MDIIKKEKSSHAVIAVVRASKRISRSNNTKKSEKYKRKFNRDLLPSASDYYSKELKRFYRRKNQATALCPFHNERNPSFSVNLTSGSFLYFSCGISGGDIISFCMKIHNVNFINACKALGVWHE